MASDRDGLIVHIPIRDEHGNVTSEIEAVSLKGLLSLAHDEELRSLRTRIVQLPSRDNGQRAVFRAIARTKRGTFTGTGDACPENVNPEVGVHLVPVAESRAIARALRLAVNIGEVAIEELGVPVVRARREPQHDTSVHRNGSNTGEEREADEGRVRGNGRSRRPERFRGRDEHPTEAAQGDARAMSTEQRKLLYRLAFSLGDRSSATERILEALGAGRLEWATRAMASKAIDALKREVTRTRRNGHANGASNGRSNGAADHG